MQTSDLMERAREELARRGGVLVRGAHAGGDDCLVCVRELRSVVLGLPWTDQPDGEVESPTDRACQAINDAPWSSDEARTEACLPLVALTEGEAADGWVVRYAEETIRHIVPIALRAAAQAHPDAKHRDALEAAAVRCEQEASADAAGDAAGDAVRAARAAGVAAWNAARDAARDAGVAEDAAWNAARAAWDARDAARGAARDAGVAASWNAAGCAAWVAGYAADAAADAARAAGVAALIRAVEVLIACHRGEPMPDTMMGHSPEEE